MSAKDEISISPLEAETIVEICFLINDVKHQLENENVLQVQKTLASDTLIRTKIDAMLASVSSKEFSRNLKESQEVVGQALKGFHMKSVVESLHIANLEQTLRKLQSLLLKIDTPAE
ncbi:hypothetical protein [Galbibacter sp. PAP.153]|uniref:hypothetical protein n=1 Tax=Galbibacter sp. PAP.153 TaxID=3104623 RepID=UPI0030080A25